MYANSRLSLLLLGWSKRTDERLQKEKEEGRKLDYKWKGPYKITDCLGKGFYRLKFGGNKDCHA